MAWYHELGSKQEVIDFTRFIGNQAPALKKVMPQCLRIRQMQLQDDRIPGTWQAKTPEGRIAEIICAFGHDRMMDKFEGNVMVGRVPAPISDFEQGVRRALGRWHATVVARTVTETEADPNCRWDARQPQYYELAATKLAANRLIQGGGALPQNPVIQQILACMGRGADAVDPELEALMPEFRRYAAEQAARDYDERMAAEDAARLDAVAAKEIAGIRKHQKMKLDGSGLKGSHEQGRFWLLTRSIDGMPILLVSSKVHKGIKDEFQGQAILYASSANAHSCAGYFTQRKRGGEIRFVIDQGQAETPVFVSALRAMGVRRANVYAGLTGEMM